MKSKRVFVLTAAVTVGAFLSFSLPARATLGFAKQLLKAAQEENSHSAPDYDHMTKLLTEALQKIDQKDWPQELERKKRRLIM